MPLINQPIAFESLDFLPGFPSLSKYTCNPWSMFFKAGSCAIPPVVVGRETAVDAGWPAIQNAIAAAGGKPTSLMGLRGASAGAGFSTPRRRAGMGHSGGADVAHRRPGVSGLGCSGCGCGSGGGCGGCSRKAYTGGGGCASVSGLGQFDLSSMQGILTWVETNWMALLVGGAAVWLLKSKFK